MAQPVLELIDVEKRYFDFVAARGVNLCLHAGRIVGLVGENGAGKSTVLNVIGGLTPPTAGAMRLEDRPFAPDGPAAAAAAGVALVHQELNLFSNLTVAENLFLADLPMRGAGPFRWIDRDALLQWAGDALEAVGLDISPATLVGALSPGERQLVEIAKALIGKPRVLLLDEPTSSLTTRELSPFFALLNRLRSAGAAILYVSHDLKDVCRLCDEIVVMRDGEVRGSGPAVTFDPQRLIPLMVGRTIESQFPSRAGREAGDVVLQVRHLWRRGVAEGISFELRRGEILGIAGLMGAGRTEVARMVFGLDAYDDGSVLVDGFSLPKNSPRVSVQRGMAFVSEDRRDEGLLPDDNVTANITLASLDRLARGACRWVSADALDRASQPYIAELGIACRDPRHQPAKTLSGGNQQKVILARWLMRDADVLIIDEPTRGVDVGARLQVYEQIYKAAARGAGILMISSDLEELIGMCDRILVMAKGGIRFEDRRGRFDRELLMSAAFQQTDLT